MNTIKQIIIINNIYYDKSLYRKKLTIKDYFENEKDPEIRK